MELLKALSEAPGAPGREERIKDIIRRQARGLFDQVREDAMGNLICFKAAGRPATPRPGRKSAGAPSARPPAGKAPKVMFACHIDEIAFYVKAIDKEGRLRLTNVGGFDNRNLFARRVLVQGRQDLLGVLNPAGKPVHIATEEEKKKIPLMHEFFVDLFLPKKQVAKLVRVGDPVTLVQSLEKIGQVYTGKAMDNRVASWVAINTVRKVGAASAYDIYYVATVQEEVGLRGAGPGTWGIDPDIAIALDTTLACDTPGVSEEESPSKMGAGVAIKIMDRGSISDRALVDEFVALAEKNRIPYQLEVLTGGATDAGAMQRTGKGYRTITISVPTRYIHTVTESVHEKDLKAAVDLLAAWLRATPLPPSPQRR
jgi:putative aminopeptidase FrvX